MRNDASVSSSLSEVANYERERGGTEGDRQIEREGGSLREGGGRQGGELREGETNRQRQRERE